MSSNILKRIKRRITHANWFLNLLAFFAATFIKAYGKTLKIDVIKDQDLINHGAKPFLAGFWHGHQFLIIQVAYLYKTAVMTDISWAGELQSRILTRLGLKAIRGSSKRQGASALIGMKQASQQGYVAAFALDGPRGPKHQAKPGILFLAKKLEIPIVPFVVSSQQKWTLKNTWCDYEIPKPFSKCRVFIGSPFYPKTDNTTEIDHHLAAAITTNSSDHW